jgi:antitoxin component YwqK of YwqJK toxin-antitoxin module
MRRTWLLMGLSILGCSPRLEVATTLDPQTQRVVEEYEYYLNRDSGEPIRHGYYRAYWPDGSPREIGQYKDNQKHGTWHYYVDGIKRVGTYKEGTLVGRYSYYDQGGNKIREGT